MPRPARIRLTSESRSSKAVSYTHLDVYKRQVGVGLEPVANELLIEGRLAVARLVALQRPEAGGTVSYTHLDVYKRQVLTCGAAMFDPKILSDMMEKGFFVAQMYGLTET